MAPELRKHLRYLRDLYHMQMKVYARYHQRDPALFYEQAETWLFANVRGQPVLPYYQTMNFGNCNEREEFVMIDPMTPINRPDLSMISMAGELDKTHCCLDYKPGISFYKFGKDVQVNGLAQLPDRNGVNDYPAHREQRSVCPTHLYCLNQKSNTRINQGNRFYR